MPKVTLTKNCILAIESILSRGENAEVGAINGRPKVLSIRKKVEYLDKKEEKMLETFDSK